MTLKVFIGEYVCGGGFAHTPINELPVSLRREGEAMLRALAHDVAEFAETVVVLDERFELQCDKCHKHPFDAGKPVWAQWLEAAKQCDFALIIAPEIDGTLAKGVSVLRSGGIDVVASSGDFLRVASDKLLTAQLLHAAGVPHPAYLSADDHRMENDLQNLAKYVVKPRDGCGTTEIATFSDFASARSALTPPDILQGWVPGRSISVSLISNGNTQVFLPAVSQSINDHSCQYTGGCGPLDDDAQRRASALAARAIAAMPPTPRGFVGLDLILGDQPSDDCVIEINARLTTSYVGLREMIKGNLAARLFDLESGPVSCKYGEDSVRWTSDGCVSIDKVAKAG